VPLEISQRFARESGATLVVEPDEGHFGHLDPENPMWQAVIKWL
jgi:pimeloyl-ACP methyl ester carboxylesterase